MIELVSGIAKASASQAASTAAGAQGPLEAAKGFAVHLAETIQAGEKAAVAGVNGTMPMNEVVQKVMEAERSLTTLTSVRDKAVGSLLELTRMQV
jgi:flagellar hook-basal body complex protein FliE